MWVSKNWTHVSSQQEKSQDLNDSTEKSQECACDQSKETMCVASTPRMFQPDEKCNRLSLLKNTRRQKRERKKEEVVLHLLSPGVQQKPSHPARPRNRTVHVHHSIKQREIYSIVAKLSVWKCAFVCVCVCVCVVTVICVTSGVYYIMTEDKQIYTCERRTSTIEPSH